MDKQQRNTLIITVFIIIVILAVVAWLLWQQFNQEDEPIVNENINQAVNTGVVVVNVNVNTGTPLINEENVEDLEISRVAILFAERFGSFSTEANYQNILDLKEYMTSKMWSWAENYVAKQRLSSSDDTFYGVTTKVLTTSVESQSDSRAELTLSTQRKETTVGESASYIQDITISMRNIEDNWKVDEATWQDVK